MPDDPSKSRFLRNALLFYLPVALSSLAWLHWRRGALLETLLGPEPPAALLLGAAAGAAVMAVGVALGRSFAFARRMERTLAALVGPLPRTHCLAAGVLSGVSEEIFFRGVLQPVLGLVATSLLFGAVHPPLVRSLWPWTIFATTTGFLLGWLFEATGALLAPIACHAVVNMVNLSRLGSRVPSGLPAFDP